MEAPDEVYCSSGHRSTTAMEMPLSYGYSNITSLSSGFGGWVDAGYPEVE
ncbi:MAG: rhodanese-like domain-containing protein [Anaerolineales bacterium]|nr:rhodanese-like domain-containing protein [Anaerolineales bacterium]